MKFFLDFYDDYREKGKKNLNTYGAGFKLIREANGYAHFKCVIRIENGLEILKSYRKKTGCYIKNSDVLNSCTKMCVTRVKLL